MPVEQVLSSELLWSTCKHAVTDRDRTMPKTSILRFFRVTSLKICHAVGHEWISIHARGRNAESSGAMHRVLLNAVRLTGEDSARRRPRSTLSPRKLPHGGSRNVGNTRLMEPSDQACQPNPTPTAPLRQGSSHSRPPKRGHSSPRKLPSPKHPRLTQNTSTLNP